MREDTPDWSVRISAWRMSGKSGASWCRDNAISYYQFKYWQKKLRPPTQHVKTGQFISLKVATAAQLRIECNGTYLHVSSGFDPVLLREVVSVLKEN